AEDGIREFRVTGVQTCALPICSTDGWSSTADTTPSSCRSTDSSLPPTTCGCRDARRTPTGPRPARRSTPHQRAPARPAAGGTRRSEEHTSELQSRENLVCRLLL